MAYIPIMSLRSTLSAYLLGLLAFAGAADAAAPEAASPWHDNAYTSVRLVAAQSGTAGAPANEPLRFGLEFRMEPDWKIYWRSPGDAGYPPAADWRESDNVAGIDMNWPAPERFSILGLETLGYSDGVIFPLNVRATQSGEAIRLHATIDYLTCSDICVPEQATVSLDLPGSDGGITRHAFDINKFETLVPKDGAAQGLTIERPAVTNDAKPALLVKARSVSGFTFHDPDMYIEGPERLSFGKPIVTLENGGQDALFEIPVYAPKREDIQLVSRDITLTLVDGGRTAEASLSVTAADPNATRASGAAGIDGLGFTILAFAFLGGLILNLMPCVLPVLAIKLAGVVGKSGAPRAVIRRGFIATAGGIVFTFLLLAGALSALKAGGMAIGWGIQFQQPVFLAVMAAIVTLFACNLWGLWTLRLPSALSSLGGAPKPDAETPISGHFMTGMLATLLATPCSAPLLGTAVGFALARGPMEIFTIFAVIGIGLATPYLIVAAAPGMATLLPKPGRWMVTFKRILALALVGTAVWLLTVIASGSGTAIAAVTGLALIAACVGLAVSQRPARATFARAGTAAALILAIALPAVGSDTAAPSSTLEADGLWEVFDRTEIDARVAAGEVILVDVTADWCLTCKVNKAVALGDPAVQMSLGQETVSAMVADWTLPDPRITEYLASFERFGIPFNAVYGPNAPDGIPLPELLRANDVLEALKRAGAPDAPAGGQG